MFIDTCKCEMHCTFLTETLCNICGLLLIFFVDIYSQTYFNMVQKYLLLKVPERGSPPIQSENFNYFPLTVKFCSFLICCYFIMTNNNLNGWAKRSSVAEGAGVLGRGEWIDFQLHATTNLILNIQWHIVGLKDNFWHIRKKAYLFAFLSHSPFFKTLS